MVRAVRLVRDFGRDSKVRAWKGQLSGLSLRTDVKNSWAPGLSVGVTPANAARVLVKNVERLC